VGKNSGGGKISFFWPSVFPSSFSCGSFFFFWGVWVPGCAVWVVFGFSVCGVALVFP